jgi:glycerol-3-phosphate dehydrogenase
MPGDRVKTEGRKRSRVVAGEDYEVQYLADQAGITPDQARTLIRRYGNDREKLMEEAKTMRSG